MKNSQLLDLGILLPDMTGAVQLVGFLLGAGGALKLASTMYTKYMDRRLKLDEYQHVGTSDFTARVWARLEAQENTINELNLEIDKKNELIFDIKLRAELLESKCNHALKDLADMKTVNEYLKVENEELRRGMPPNNPLRH